MAGVKAKLGNNFTQRRKPRLRPETLPSADFDGALTMHGITQPVTLHVTLEPLRQPVTRSSSEEARAAWIANAKARISRSAFNMTAFSFLVDDEIDVEINAALVPKETRN